jgi:hypothetical protein
MFVSLNHTKKAGLVEMIPTLLNIKVPVTVRFLLLVLMRVLLKIISYILASFPSSDLALQSYKDNQINTTRKLTELLTNDASY